MTDRPRQLDGPTYRVTLGDGSRMYVTVNAPVDENGIWGDPFEVFVRYDDADMYEWVGALTTMITRLLRAGQSLDAIGKELQEIHSPGTGHHIPGAGEWSPSIVARIGRVFIQHAEKFNNKKAAA